MELQIQMIIISRSVTRYIYKNIDYSHLKKTNNVRALFEDTKPSLNLTQKENYKPAVMPSKQTPAAMKQNIATRSLLEVTGVIV